MQFMSNLLCILQIETNQGRSIITSIDLINLYWALILRDLVFNNKFYKFYLIL